MIIRLWSDDAEPAEFVRCPRCLCLFRPVRVAPPYEAPLGDVGAQSYLEGVAQIDQVVTPLFKVNTARVKTYLDVGCAAGFSLDFADFAWGWRGRGAEPSTLALAGREALDLDIHHGYLDRDTFGERFHLVGSGDVIEHVAEPRAFVADLASYVADDGALVLAGPNASAIAPDADENVIRALLNPQHLALPSASTLDRMLRENGFEFVRIWDRGAELHAVAAHDDELISEGGEFDRGLYRRYLGERYRTSRDVWGLKSGLGYRLYKESLFARDFQTCDELFESLREPVRARYGIDICTPAAFDLDVKRWTMAELAQVMPFFATELFYYRGSREIQRDRPGVSLAIEYFNAAIAAGVATRALGEVHEYWNLEADLLTNEAAHARLQCIRQLPPREALNRLTAAESKLGDDSQRLAYAEARAELERIVFIESIAAGDYGRADDLAANIRRVVWSDGKRARTAQTLGLQAQTLFALGMFALNHEADPAQAATYFDEAHRLSVDALREDPSSEAARQIVWWSLFSEGLCRRALGDADRAVATARTLERPTDLDFLPAPDEALVGRLSELYS